MITRTTINIVHIIISCKRCDVTIIIKIKKKLNFFIVQFKTHTHMGQKCIFYLFLLHSKTVDCRHFRRRERVSSEIYAHTHKRIIPTYLVSKNIVYTAYIILYKKSTNYDVVIHPLSSDKQPERQIWKTTTAAAMVQFKTISLICR